MNEAASTAPARLSGFSFETREVAARIYLSLRRSGMKANDARSHIQSAIPNVSERTLRHWVTQFESQGPLFSQEKGSGRPKCLNDEKIRILVGWILTSTDFGKIVTMKKAHSFLTNVLCTEASERTVRNNLSALGIVTRNAQVDSRTNIGLDEKVDLYKTWIENLRSSGCSSKLMCSLDFTYTSHRTARTRTLAGSGRKTLSQLSKTRFTNCIITGVLSDGRQLQSIFYTYNPCSELTESKQIEESSLRTSYIEFKRNMQ